MSKDVAPPTTHVGDTGIQERTPDQEPANIYDQIFTRGYADKAAVDNVANLVSKGKIENKDEVLSQALKACDNNQTKAFQNAVNEKLEQMNSSYRIKIDDSMAHVQDIGGIQVDLIDQDSRKVADSCSRTIDNSPKVPGPPTGFPLQPAPETPPTQQLPSDWPRLDIVVPPTRRPSPWG